MIIGAADAGCVGTSQADTAPLSTGTANVLKSAWPIAVLHRLANALETFGTVPTSVHRTLPLSSAAVVVAHGFAEYFAWARYSSSTLAAALDSMNWLAMRMLS
jgi:hypothetical protein